MAAKRAAKRDQTSLSALRLHASYSANRPGSTMMAWPLRPPLTVRSAHHGRAGAIARLRHYHQIMNDTIGMVRGRFDAYGDIYFVPNRDGGLYVCNHPDHIRDVLITHGSSFGKAHSAFARLARVLGQGLLTTDGAIWKRHRRMIQPAFHKPRLEGYSHMMVAEAEHTARRWRDGNGVDLGADMTALTLRVVSRSLFSYEVAGDVDAVTGAVSVLQDSFSRPNLLPRWLPTARRRRVRRSIASIDDMMYRMIAARRAGSRHGRPRQCLHRAGSITDAGRRARRGR